MKQIASEGKAAACNTVITSLGVHENNKGKSVTRGSRPVEGRV